MAEFEQLALDPAVSPVRVLPRHPTDQRGDGVVDGWASGPVRVGPLLRTRRRCQRRIVPGVTRRWPRSTRWQASDQGGEDGPVGPVQTSHGLGVSSSILLMLLGVVGPGGVLVVAAVGLEAAVQDADQAVAELAQGGVVAGPAGAQAVVVGAGSG